jgi:hypothetical protein
MASIFHRKSASRFGNAAGTRIRECGPVSGSHVDFYMAGRVYLPCRTKDRFHLVLGLSAGLLLGLVAFDLNPTIYAHMGITWGGLPASHILPEAHASHPSRFTMGATALGVAIMWVVVRTLS